MFIAVISYYHYYSTNTSILIVGVLYNVWCYVLENVIGCWCLRRAALKKTKCFWYIVYLNLSALAADSYLKVTVILIWTTCSSIYTLKDLRELLKVIRFVHFLSCNWLMFLDSWDGLAFPHSCWSCQSSWLLWSCNWADGWVITFFSISPLTAALISLTVITNNVYFVCKPDRLGLGLDDSIINGEMLIFL